MSKQEMYAWSSLGFTLAIFAYYLVSAFGLPTGFENYSGHLTSLIWQVIIISVLIEFCLGLLSSTKFGGIMKDERDILIESKGFRNGYYFFIVSVITLIGHILINDFLSEVSGGEFILSRPFETFHLLVFILFISHIIKTSTQLFYYRVTN